MATEVKVPTTGNSGEPAVVLEWTVTVGDVVSAGDVVATLETAKAVVEVDVPCDGVILDIRYAEGDEAPEYDVLLVLGEPGETVPTTDPASTTPTKTDGGQEPATPSPTSDEDDSTAADGPHHGTHGGRAGRISISPRARRLATERGIPIEGLVGTGPFGRIVIADIPSAAAGTVAAPREELAPEITPSSATRVGEPSDRGARGTRVAVRGARKVTAQRMHASLAGTAQVTLTRYAHADALLNYAARLREATEARGARKIGVNDLLLFATARTVAHHPAANSWFDWDGITQFDHVDLGFAVDTGAVLLVPVIRDAHTLTLSQLAEQAQDAIARARAGKTPPEEMDGGTFTVSNLGGAGVHWFTPVLNTPQSCILGVGAAHRAHPDVPAQLPLSLTFDHRALDGAAAAALLADLATSVQHIDTLAAF